MTEGVESGVQKEEITSLKEKYGRQCRILPNVGEYTYVINMLPTDSHLSVKFQLGALYPESIPDILARSNSMLPEEVENLQDFLTSKAKELTGCHMVDQLYRAGCLWLEERGVDLVKAKVKKTKRQSKPRGKEKQLEKDDSATDKKLVSMKTSEDVISRILWDEQLPTECFIVGYLDRFKGIIEKAFTAFSWEDVASVDLDVLAIPKHRIQYFKYKDLKIWDKRERLDLVFGSTGSKLSIREVIINYEEDLLTRKRTSVSESDKYQGNEQESVPSSEIGSSFIDTSFLPNRDRPNYFICLRITDTGVKEEVQALQNVLTETEPNFSHCCIPVEVLHITLCTIRLDTPEQMAEACLVLRNSESELKAIACKKIIFNIEGIDHFHNRVLYAKVQQDKDFADFVQCLRSRMTEQGLTIMDPKEFVPHMTIMKLTKQQQYGQQRSGISLNHYEPYQHKHFGSQNLETIQLCSMVENKGDDGFYSSLITINVIK